MRFFKKYRFGIIFFVLITILFFFLRLYRIDSLPIFTDEAIYTRWSQIARYDASWRFISLTDGKQPMFVWADTILMRVINDPLLAGRLVSVVTGFFTMIGLFFLGKEIFKNYWVGIISSFLYVIFPFALVYDRMALYDSMVGTFAVWSLYLEILLIRKIRLDVALILGMVIGMGVLTKTSAFFSIYLLPFSLILFDFKTKKRVNLFFKWIGLALVSVILAYAVYSILRLSPFFHIISDKNSIFVYPFNEWLTHPFTYLHGNIKGVWNWFWIYMTWPFIILIILSFVVDPKRLREKLLLFIWFIVPFLGLALFGRTMYPRFIFFMTLPLLPLIALSLIKIAMVIKKPIFIVIIFLGLCFFALRSDYYILTDFARAPIPYLDLEQYINGWPSGSGIKEAIAYLSEKSSNKKIYVATEGTFGSLPTYSVEIYLGDNKNVEKRGVWPVPDQIPQDLPERAKTMPVYFIFNETQVVPKWPQLKLIKEYQKGIGDSYMRFYEVVPQ
ncbi:MAG: glycosyltransferase family 39 protein [Patescibacteria group bacterium]|nr:glycosyltransferase family 39 protein [Patescibacteria group bacterium]